MVTLICTRTTCLTSFNAAPRTFSLPAKATVASFSTARPTEQRAKQNKRPAITAQLSTAQATKPASRHASSKFTSSSRLSITANFPTAQTSQPTLRHASSTSTSPSTQEPDENILTWNRFFDLRRKRRWINVGCSAVTAVGAVGIFTPILAQQDLDSWGAQISGLDPIVVLGISTFAVAAGGWLCGPSFGTAMFSLWAGRRGWNKLIAEKEKSFYARIKRYRADASASSPQNPIPDYYGEKIASVKDYRRWLKDQRAFNLKKNKNML